MNAPVTAPSLSLSTLAAALLLAGLPAQAQNSPFYIGARQTFTHDSNVYRTPDGTSDWISSTGIVAGLDKQISRQRVRANLGYDWNRYRDQERLNHNSGNALVRLDWETLGNLSGDLQFGHQQQLYRDYLNPTDAQNKTVVRNTDALFNARLGVVTTWTLEGGVFANRTRYRGALAGAGDMNYEGVRAGVRYNPRSQLSFGIGVRRAEGEYPNAGSASDFTREDVDLVLTWEPTGTSRLDGWIARSRWDYEQAASRNNSLTTGSLRYLYRPGGRWNLEALVKRDDNAGQYGIDRLAIVNNQIVALQGQAIDTRVVNTYALAGTYELTGKTRLNASLQRVDRRLDNSLTRTGAPAAEVLTARDRTHSASIAATWDATRNISVSCGLSHAKRSVADGSAALTYPYSVNLANCSAQVALNF